MKLFSKLLPLPAAVVFFLSSFLVAQADQVTAGSTVVLSVTADGTAPFTYQWTKDGANLAGSTGQTLSISNIQTPNSGSYSVVVSNAAGSTTSDISTLAIVIPPTIATQPLSQSAGLGANVTFTVAASGVPAPTYQWKKDGVSLNGATGSSYTISSITTGNAGNYTVVVTNSVSSVVSTSAVLTVVSTNTAPLIATQPLSQNVGLGANVTFTVAASGVPAPTYQWKKDGASINGATGSSYTISSVATGNAGAYTAVVTNSVGSVTSNIAVLSIDSTSIAPVIITQPSSQTASVGSAVNFAVTATGSPAPTYQWKFNGNNILNATGNTFTISSITANNVGVYSVVVTNSAGYVASNQAILSLIGTPAIDLFWQNKVTGQRSVWYLDGTKVLSGVNLWNVDPSWDIAAVVDLNGDGKPDVLWQNKVTGQRSVWYLDGTKVLSGVNLWNVDPSWDIAAVVDLNGDGKPDILWQNAVTGQRSVWYLDGTKVLSGVNLWNVDISWSIAK